MKPIAPQLLALLQSGAPLYETDVYQFDLVGIAGALRYCTGPDDVRLNGTVYSAGGFVGPWFERKERAGRVHLKVGVEVDQLVVDVLPGTAVVLGVPFLQACAAGVFDGATVSLRRLFMPTYGDTRRGAVRLFFGRVAEISVGRSEATFSVNSHLELLNQNFPRNRYQAGCLNNLGDVSCGVSLALLAVPLTALAGSTSSVISATFTSVPTGRFDQGKVLFTSGALAGVTVSVKTAIAGAPGTISLLAPLPTAPANGDAFSIYPGCDKTFSGTNGCPKFANQARFRGMDLIPVPETAL